MDRTVEIVPANASCARKRPTIAALVSPSGTVTE